MINEAGLNQLILRSRKKEAIKFQEWICEFVIPSIIKKGSYSIDETSPDDLPLDILDDIQLMNSKATFYIFEIAFKTYKFGVTTDYYRRKKEHEEKFKNLKPVLARDVNNMTIAFEIDDKLKGFFKSRHSLKFFCTEESKIYEKNIRGKKMNLEIFQTNKELSLKYALKIVNGLIDLRTVEIKTITNNNDINYEKYKNCDDHSKTIFFLTDIVNKTNENNKEIMIKTLDSYIKSNQPSKTKSIENIINENDSSNTETQQITPLSNPIKSSKKRIHKKTNMCPDCGVAIHKRSTRCRPCVKALQQANKKQKAQCITCNKEINYGSKRCKPCEIERRKIDLVVEHKCVDCGITVNRHSDRCRSCAALTVQKGKTHRPSREQLIKDRLELHTYMAIGRKYGVSDNAVRKWVKFYNKEDNKVLFK